MIIIIIDWHLFWARLFDATRQAIRFQYFPGVTVDRHGDALLGGGPQEEHDGGVAGIVGRYPQQQAGDRNVLVQGEGPDQFAVTGVQGKELPCEPKKALPPGPTHPN
jgi:hypothetical protein